MHEMGLVEIWERRWWNRTSFCSGSVITEPTPIDLIDMQSAFYLVFIGITLALMVLGMERFCHRFSVIDKVVKCIFK